MRKFVILFLLLSMAIQAQNYKIVEDPKTHKDMLVGKITVDAFSDTTFAWWYRSEYNFYRIDKESLAEIKRALNDSVNVKIFMGTWCSDSRREVPRFVKILDSLNFNNYELIAVDREKHGLDKECEGWDIELVPTIIILKGNEELGRIVEAPDESLELDFENFLISVPKPKSEEANEK